uniref:Uncharacterized protein n=1 Tax=Setaria viridis TaxID=4556 RepID=A0A4U6WID3_SETVI|nr:hypothetical protein SEVIR_1G349650v2 [Setaria viridis]
MQMRLGFNRHKRKGLDSSFMLISWTIWRERNDRVFGRLTAQSTAQITMAITQQAQLWIETGATMMSVLGWPAAAERASTLSTLAP